MKIDGVTYCQIQAINRYLTRLSDFPELSSSEEMTSQMVIETTNDMFDEIVKPAFKAAREMEDAGKVFYIFLDFSSCLGSFNFFLILIFDRLGSKN